MNLWTTGLLVLLSLCFGAAAWLLFLWSVRSGQLDDPEAPKHRMLDDDDEDGPPEEAPRAEPVTLRRESSRGGPGAPGSGTASR